MSCGGAARLAPLGGAAFTVGGLSLCGLPLLAGFSAKYCIAAAALDAEWQTAPALFGLAASSVLNAMYYIPAILAIWGRARAGEDAPVVWMLGQWEGKCHPAFCRAICCWGPPSGPSGS